MEEQTQAAQEPQQPKNPFAVVALKELSKVDKGIAALKKTYGNVVFDVTTTKGIEQAKKARAAIREVRYKVEHVRKAEASKIKAAQTELNAEAERITSEIMLIESPIHAQITAEEERKEREAAEAARKEQERISAIRAEIDRLVGTPARAASENLSIDGIQAIITALGSEPLDAEFFKEFLPEAEHTRGKVIDELRTLIARIQLREEEAARLKEQEARLAAQEAEIAALRAQLAAASAAAAAIAGVPPVAAAPAPAEPPVEGLVLSTYKGEVVYDRAAGIDATAAVAVSVDPDTGEILAQEVGVAAGMPVELLDAVDDGERLFEDDTPSTDRIVLAVSSHFGVDDETAKRYITRAAEVISFETF